MSSQKPSSSTSRPPDDSRVEVRPLRLDGEPALLALESNLSEEKLRPPRFFAANALVPDFFSKLCRLDSTQDAGFVAQTKDSKGKSQLLGLCRCFFNPKTNSAELGLEIIKPWQGEGLSDRLLKPMIATARERGVRQLITGAQAPMITIATRFGFLMNMIPLGSDGTFTVVRSFDRGIDLRKYDPASISKTDVKFLVSSMREWPGLKQELEDFFLEVDPAYAVQCLDELFHGPDAEIRSDAVELLVSLKGPDSLPWVEECLQDDDVGFRCAGCSFLAELHCPETVPRLLRVLREDPSDWVRYSAVDALERCGDMSAIPALKQTAKNDRGTDYEGRPIRDRAREAIRRITQRNR